MGGEVGSGQRAANRSQSSASEAEEPASARARTVSTHGQSRRKGA